MLLLKYRKYKRIVMLVTDMGIVLFLYFLSSLLIHDFTLPGGEGDGFYLHVGIVSLMYVLVFYLFRLYGSLWTVAGYYDYLNIVLANLMAGVLSAFYDVFVLGGKLSLPLIIIASGGILLGTLGNRMFFRIYRRLLYEKKNVKGATPSRRKNILLVSRGGVSPHHQGNQEPSGACHEHCRPCG